MMKKFALAALAAGFMWSVPTTVSAQDSRIRIDERGVTIRSDSDRRDRWRDREERRRDRWVERRRFRDRDEMRTGSTRCRTVTVRRENSDGDVTVRRMRRCS